MKERKKDRQKIREKKEREGEIEPINEEGGEERRSVESSF